MGLTLRLEQGVSRDFPLQAYNRDGSAAVDLFETSDVLACQVWAGDGMPVLATPLATWVDVTAGEFQISFFDTDTLALAPSMYRIRCTATRANQTASLLPTGSRLQIVNVPGSSVCTDLVTQDYLAASLAAGEIRLTTAQLEVLPGLAKSASRAIRRHCNRYFNRRPNGPAGLLQYDGLYAIDWPSRTFLLRQYPVNAPPRVRTNPTPILTIYNNDTTTNQQAWVVMSTDGSVEDIDDVPPATIGLVLYSVASGVTTNTAYLWSTYPTVGQLATIITEGGGGWVATVADGFADWSSADFRAGQGSQPALGFQTQVGFSVFASDVPCIYNARSGIVTLSEQLNDPFTSPRFGVYLQTDLDDVQVYGGPQGIRVTYDAGWTIVPEDVQSACAETVLDWLYKLSLDQNLGSESDGARSIVVNTAFANYSLPKSVVGKLAPYRSPRA